jgi:adenylate cyclase
VRAAFGQYLSPELVEQLAGDPGRLVLGGETREMTVLFCDVREFTSLSESYKADPQALTALINRLLTPLSGAILDHGGTIDKYMGDNVMAFWNAPLDDPEHPRNACATALAMLERLEAVNAEREAEARAAGDAAKRLEIGVGVNTGECVVGNMGSDMRFDYTVVGDAVNLAARLEGQSAFYGVRIILGEATAKRIGEEFIAMELDLIRVKGKGEPERIYTILGRRVAADAADNEAARESVEAVIAADRGRDWDGAQAALEAAEETRAGREFPALCDLYAARIAEFRKTPPPEDWDGVYTATRK